MTMLLESALTTGIAALAGVVAVLWKRVSNNMKSVEDRLSQCEEDRQKLWKRIAGDS